MVTTDYSNEYVGYWLNGWMADFGEWCPWFVQDSIYNSIVNDSKINSIKFPARNSYTNKWALLNNDVIESSGRDDLLFFMRSGSALSANSAPMFWMGDQSVNWGKEDGLKSTLTALNSAAMSGIAYLHSDIGGYTTVDNAFVKVKRDKDLFFRWAELNVFQPFYRTHEGLKPNSNHQFYSDDSTMQFFAKMGKLHFRLKDYMLQYQERNNLALIHPLLLNFPDDTTCATITNQFMCGDELMVAPISDKKTFERNVYFPPGKWMHLFTKKYTKEVL
jgi:alpha-glucosidase